MSRNRCSEHAVDGVVWCGGYGVWAGTGIRVGIGEGYTGYYPAALLGERSRHSGAGPGSPAGAGVGGVWSSGARCTTLRARSGPCRPLPCTPPRECRLRANKARNQSIFSKVSQNGRVSLRNVEKACHSPCSQNGAQKSPLEIPRFPFSLAFSPKELMVLF